MSRFARDERRCAWGFMRQLRDFERELGEARAQGRLLGRVQINAAAADRAALEAMESAETELKKEAEEEEDADASMASP